VSCGLHQNIHSLLEGASHEGSGVLPIDPVPRDGHQVTLGRHHVTQHRQVPVVHVNTVEGEHHVHFLFHTLSDSLNTKARENLTNIIRTGPYRVNISLCQNLHQCSSVRLKQPLSNPLELSTVSDHNPFLVIIARQVHVHFLNGLQPLQSHVGQHVGLNTAEEHVVLHFISLVLFIILTIIPIHNPNTKNQFLSIVVVKDTVEVVPESCVYLLTDVLHSESLVSHPLPVQLDPEKPGRDTTGVEVRHLIVDVDELLVLCYNRVLRVWVVVDGSVGGDLPESSVLQSAQHGLSLLSVPGSVSNKEDSKRRSLWVLRYVDDLLETRHTQGYVLRGHPSEVEGVQGHLSGRLSNRLSSKGTYHLARGDHCQVEPRLYFSQQPVERFFRQLVILSDNLCAEGGSYQALEQNGGVVIGLERQPVLPWHNDALLQKVPHTSYHLHWVQVHRVPLVDMKDLLSIPDHPLQVTGQHNPWVSLGEDLPQTLPVLDQLLPLPFNLCHHLALSDHLTENLVCE